MFKSNVNMDLTVYWFAKAALTKYHRLGRELLHFPERKERPHREVTTELDSEERTQKTQVGCRSRSRLQHHVWHFKMKPRVGDAGSSPVTKDGSL